MIKYYKNHFFEQPTHYALDTSKDKWWGLSNKTGKWVEVSGFSPGPYKHMTIVTKTQFESIQLQIKMKQHLS